MNNEYMEHAAYETQVVLNCTRDEALKVVSWVNCLGGDPVAFVHRLPQLLDSPTPGIDVVLEQLQALAAQQNVRLSDVCFPTGYQNREARRKAHKKGHDR
jgi:hypothetical protein